ncbi:ESX-1 secretion-associated protein [Gordonia sp. X0973]|uniref:type VII secretion target n=1 Tax=Gordonia sp. X0973 TaxID=2742602 RepID=UPI000F54A1C4|nr:type VII secretion target [Gordonia sp. X0973]QKT06728.1 ESX-1 secretion-associated protein [Gordonia sp. X0973]
MTVSLHAPTAHRFASDHADVGARTAAGAASIRGDAGALVPTFGLIGAEFLAATAEVLDRCAHHLDRTAARHVDIAESTRSGVEAYQGTDAAATRALGV